MAFVMEKLGKGALPPSQCSPSSFMCVCVYDFTLKYLIFLKVVAEHSYGQPPTLLTYNVSLALGSPTPIPLVLWGRLPPRGSISRDLGKPLRLSPVYESVEGSEP